MLVFLEYIFQFFINNALPASNSVDRQNFMGKSVKDDQFNSTTNCCGAIDNAFSYHVDGSGFDSRRRKFSFLFLFFFVFLFYLFFFVKDIFIFWQT